MIFVGCFTSGTSSELETYPVKGAVFVDDVPARFARIKLMPIDDSGDRPTVTGFVDQEGAFELMAEPGDYFVSISWRIPKFPFIREKERQYGPELLPEKYRNPATSGLSELRVTVDNELEELPPFRLSRKE